MSEVLGFVVLALSALGFVVKVGAELFAVYEQRRMAAVVAHVHVTRAVLGLPPTGVGLMELPGYLDALGALFRRWRRALRHVTCVVLNGRHELYRARTDTRLFQQCLLCGYETKGWTIDRRDRRLHLVPSGAARYSKAS